MSNRTTIVSFRSFANGIFGIVCLVAAFATVTTPSALASEIGSEFHPNVGGSCQKKACTAAFFLAERSNPEVLIFNTQAKIIGRIPALARASLATDSARRLYVSGYFQQAFIDVYSPPLYDKPLKIPVPAGQKANGVTVDARSGMLAVFSGSPRASGGEVRFYQSGVTTPCDSVLSNRIGAFVGKAAFDREGTLFADVFTQNGTVIASIPGGCNAHSIQPLTFKRAYTFLDYFGFNINDDLVIQNGHGADGRTIYTFHHPQNGAFADPILATNLNRYSGLGEYFVCLLHDGKHLWGTSYRNISLYDYPAGGAPLMTMTGSIVGDSFIAIVPPLQP